VLNSSFELSDYASWNELSAVLAPLFDKASTLAPDSPLKAEAAKIKAASTDPKVRAAAAFHLVEDQVRYVFLGMDLGGYVPADADVTWTRRFGDCKGKTVLLLALLRELDIKAQPAMVSTRLGDALPERLPGVELFNHVIVKAEIGGKIYWLDGTRSGDGDIDNLYTPDFRNDLPLSDAGADLEAMPIAPLDRPLIEDHWTIDATAGVNAPAPIHIETIRRGDLGVTEGLTSEHQTAADEEASIRKDWAASHRWIEIKKVSFSFDRAKGEFHKVIDGAASLGWDLDASAGALRYETDNTYLGEKTAYKRTEGPLDAPFAIFHPFASTYTETILLPRGGKGFSVVGADVNQDIPGEEYRRKAHIENGKLTTETSERSTAFEITSAQADDARVAERVLSNVTVYLQTPPGYADGPAEKALRLARKPETESEFRDHADALFDKGDYDGAVKDLTQAITLKSDSEDAFNARCFMRAEANKDLDEALKDCNEALKRTPDSGAILDSRGLVYYRQGKFDLALKDYDAALSFSEIASSRFMRGLVLRKLGRVKEGDADIAQARKANADVAATYAKYGIKP
jgi:tetratricopeptide (TPR) repeat protein